MTDEKRSIGLQEAFRNPINQGLVGIAVIASGALCAFLAFGGGLIPIILLCGLVLGGGPY
jgi:hypothetical protein